MTSLKLPGNHPLYHPLKLRIRTPAVNQLHETLTQWLWTGAIGGFIEGPPRTGKTTALKILSSVLITRYGKPIPCHTISVGPKDKRTIQGLYRNLCISAGIGIHDSRSTNSDIYLEPLFHFLNDLATKAQSDHVVLFVDEMQRLHIDQIEAFASLHDLMATNDIYLSVFFTGNDTECDTLIRQIKDRSRRHIEGRFFKRKTLFNGIRSKIDLEKCLEQYDMLRFPENSGPTYTESCLPMDVKMGFRLKALAPEMWACFRGIQKDYGVTSWGMQYFASTIMTLLLDYLPHHGVKAFCPEMLERCIEVSGLLTDIDGDHDE